MISSKRLYTFVVVFALAALLLGGMSQSQAAPSSAAAPPAQQQNPYSQDWLATNHGKFDNVWTAAYETSLQQQAHPELFNGATGPAFGTDVRMSSPSFNTGQNEFQISINPTDSHFAIGSSNDSLTAGVGLYRTSDSGQTWTPRDAPVPAACCDPGVVYAYNGVAYAIILDTSPAVTYIISSTDNGLTWSAPTNVATPDRPNITVDNGASSPRRGTVYVTYSELPGSNRIKGYKSTDNGVTWSASFFVGDTAPPAGYEQASQPQVASDGTLYVGYQQYTNSSTGCSAGVQNVLAKSTDGGATFSYTVVPIIQGGACVAAQAGRGIFCINSGGSSFRSRSQFVVGINPTNPQRVYVIYSGGDLDTPYSCGGGTGFHSDILFRISTDGGATFSAASKINTDPQGKDQYFPWMDVSADGALHVGWNDRREDPNDFLSRWYQAYSTNEGASWTESPVADVQTQPSTFIGDYHGLAATNDLELGMWYDSRIKASGDPYTDPNVPSGGNTPTPTVTPGGPTFTPTNTPTRTSTATAVPTGTPTPCLGADPVVNGGFETGTFAPWVISDTVAPSVVSNAQAHSGTYSALLGNLSGTEPNGYSSIYQQVTVPTGGGTLSYWYWPFTTDSITFDWQDAYIENTSGVILATVMHVDDNFQAWTHITFNMTPYAGQTVRIVFLVHEDGFGDDTAMYVDDVSMAAIVGCGTPTMTPMPATSTPTMTPMPATSTPTMTPMPATSTPTMTPMPATSTATAVPPTSTPLPPTMTPLPPTNTPGGPTNTPRPTNTTAPTNTPGGPTNTPRPTSTTAPTNTPGGPTNTPVVPTVTPTDCPNPFVDINGNTFYYAIHYLYCRGVVNGLDPTHYAPAGTATRGQFAKVVVLGFGTPFYTPSSGQSFTDVPPSYFAYIYIETGFHYGILSGFDPVNCTAHGQIYPCYLPNLPITRGQLTKLVVNAGGYTLITPTGGGQDFSDVPPSNVFYVSIETAYHNNIINGYPGGYFLPNQNIRRDQMAQIVYEGIIHRP